MAMLSSPHPGQARSPALQERLHRASRLESKLINGFSWIPMDFTGFLSMNINEYQ
jgi:hypothetical protein